MLPHPLTLDQALARGEVLAADTTESTHVIRVGEWVYKFLKRFEQTPFQTAEDRRRQIQLRVRESCLHRELNPLVFDEPRRCLVSRFVSGREATHAESSALSLSLKRSRRGYIQDVGAPNIRLGNDCLVVVDFVIIEHHWDWIHRELPAPTESSQWP